MTAPQKSPPKPCWAVVDENGFVWRASSAKWRAEGFREELLTGEHRRPQWKKTLRLIFYAPVFHQPVQRPRDRRVVGNNAAQKKGLKMWWARRRAAAQASARR